MPPRFDVQPAACFQQGLAKPFELKPAEGVQRVFGHVTSLWPGTQCSFTEAREVSVRRSSQPSPELPGGRRPSLRPSTDRVAIRRLPDAEALRGGARAAPACGACASTTCATPSARRWRPPGAPLRAIQEWMGHRDYRTTSIYADHAPDPSNGRRWAEAAFGESTNSPGNVAVTADPVGRFDGVPRVANSGS